MTTYDTYCGLTCEDCSFKESHGCGGCIATGGRPFHGACEVAACAIKKGRGFCGECAEFPCELLKRYSYDETNGDQGARIENCKRIKTALVAEAREGVDPIAYCGFSCNHCFLGQWCGSCRSAYNCCSYATICEGGVCPNASCCREKGLDGCWECPDLPGCKKGFYSKEKDGEFAAKGGAMFIRAHGKAAAQKALTALLLEHPADEKHLETQKCPEDAVKALERYL